MRKLVLLLSIISLLCCGCISASTKGAPESFRSLGMSGSLKEALEKRQVGREASNAILASLKYDIRGQMEKTNVNIEGHDYEYIAYSEEKNGILSVRAIRTKEKNIVVPAQIDGRKVTSLIAGEFISEEKTKDKLKKKRAAIWNAEKKDHKNKLVVSEGIENISAVAEIEFYFREVILPKSLKKIGQGTFYGDYIDKIKVNSSDVSIGYQDFIEFPNDFRGEIKSNAFDESGLESFDWPDSMSILSDDIDLASCDIDSELSGKVPLLRDCKNLKKIQFKDNQKWIGLPRYAFTGCSKLKKLLRRKIRKLLVMRKS